MNNDDEPDDTSVDNPSPDDVEFVSIDPVPYLQRLLTGLPASEGASVADAALRREIERGLKDPVFGLRLLVEDPRFDGACCPNAS